LDLSVAVLVSVLCYMQIINKQEPRKKEDLTEEEKIERQVSCIRM
jgi:hypothetical protein